MGTVLFLSPGTLWATVIPDMVTLVGKEADLNETASNREDLLVNTNRSVDAYFRPQPRRDEQKDWVPVIPAKGILVVFRL